MRRFSALGTALALTVVSVGLVVTLTAESASACSCAALTDEEAFDAAEVVFTGRLLETRLQNATGPVYSSGDPERFYFDVDKVFKGQAADDQAVVTARDGASCGLEIGGRGPFLVFAYRDRDGIAEDATEGELSSHLCSGTRWLSAGKVPAGFGVGSGPVGETAGIKAVSEQQAAGAAMWVILVLVGAGLLGPAS
jgi:hypothetical protein